MVAEWNKSLLVVALFSTQFAVAQVAHNPAEYNLLQEDVEKRESKFMAAGRTLYQRNTGMIIGLQRGKFTSIELGGEAHWRKISLLKPRITGATANLEYNFGSNVLGYKAGLWMKRGRINLTYGANVSYFTNFNNGNRFGIGPSVGFRLLGLHLVNGINILTKDKTTADEKPIDANTLYMSLRYYFPVKNDFTWDRKTMKKNKERKRERLKRKKEREKNKDDDNKGILNLFKKKD